jgi:hypothetical protein
MFTLRKIRGNTSSILITIFLFVVITSLPAISTTSTTINRVYGQQPNQMNLTVAESSADIQNNTSEEKIVHVGDIDIAYKMLGRGEPIVLLPGDSAGMNAWDPSFISNLSSNHTVIVFDPR